MSQATQDRADPAAKPAAQAMQAMHGSSLAGVRHEPPPAEPGQESLTGHLFHGDPATGQAKKYVRGPLPPMPKIGLPEETYLHVAAKAQRNGEDLIFEAAKVGQYVSLALRDADGPWQDKVKLFRHALKRHCQPPEHADEMTKGWFKKLAHHVKGYFGAEALRLAGEQDERFDARASMGQSREDIADDAEKFFDAVCPHCDTCPPVYNDEEWRQLRIYRDRWI